MKKIQNEKKRKTKEVVWDVLRTGIAPEKKLWTAGTEIYRLVMSNGESGEWNRVKSKLGFRFLDSKFGRKFLRGEFLMFWLGFSLLKHDFGLQKIFFVQILIKLTPVEFCIFQKFCKIVFSYFVKILIFSNFVPKIIFLIFLIIFVVFFYLFIIFFMILSWVPARIS